jgi:flagellin-like hook-associated protein FlgL
MSSIPATFGRVPNLLTSRISSTSLAGTNIALLRLQEQLSTGQRVNRASDDAIAAAMISALDFGLERDVQIGRNLTHADSVLSTLDASLSDVHSLLLEAKTIASSQIGVGSDASIRAAESQIVGSLIDSMFATLNRDIAGIHYFGGDNTGERPIESFFGGYRYQGSGSGLPTELGDEIDFPITIGADQAAGTLSARQQGTVDLDPLLTSDTRVRDFGGPAVGNLPLGSIEVTIDDGVTPVIVTVDLSGADTAGDVANAIESAILTQDAAALTGGYPTNVGFAGEQFAIGNVAGGYSITFADGPTGTSASALGLDSFTFDNLNAVSTNAGASLDPKLTYETRLGDLNPGAALTYGDVVFNNGGRTGTVTTTPAMTIGEFREAVSRLDLGVRIEISETGDSINAVNEVSGFRMSIDEGGSTAATTLGIRTLKPDTPLSVLNDGRGVQIADGEINPTTGLPDPNRNVDFEITLTDGSTFQVDLTPADIGTVQDVIDKINADAVTAGFGGVFTAALTSGANGITFQDTAGGVGSVSVQTLNGYAAEDLGLVDGTYTGGAPAIYAGEDRATVRVESVMSTLEDLRLALLNNDERGITFAGTLLEAELERISTTQALVGARVQRVDQMQSRLDQTMLLDQSIRSELRDLDFVEASTQFSLLQTQLQAGYQTVAAMSQLNLLSFLG